MVLFYSFTPKLFGVASAIAIRIMLAVAVGTFLIAVARADVSGKVPGAVKDRTGAALPDATVAITNLATGVAQDARTDVGSAIQLQVVLELAAHSETVNVTRDATRVETSDTQRGQAVTRRFSGRAMLCLVPEICSLV
jgi:hypothetical protein